jgi:hypothetical protein
MYVLHVSAFGHLHVLCISYISRMLTCMQLHRILCCYRVYIIYYKGCAVIQ